MLTSLWQRPQSVVSSRLLPCSLALLAMLTVPVATHAQQPFLIDFINEGATGPPEQGGNGDLNNFSAGYEFTVGAADVSVSELGYYSPVANLLENHDVAIYDASGGVVAAAEVLAGAATDVVASSGGGGFKYASISPVTLAAGATYRIAGYNNGAVEGFNFASGAIVTSSDAMFGISAGDPAAAAIDFPDLAVPIGAPGCCIGPNFKYVTLDVTTVADGHELWSVDIQGGPAGGTFGQFGDPQDKSGVEPNYGYGNVWNHFTVQGFDNATTQSDPEMNLVDANGAASSVSFKINGDVQGWAGNNAWSSGLVGPGTASESALIADYMFLNAGQSAPSVTWELSGLTPGAEYEMFIYASIVADDANRQLGFGIDQLAATAVVGEPGMLFTDIVADGTGTITGSAGLPLTGEQNWAGFQLRQTAVPEPSGLSMLLLTAAIAFGRRRR